MSIEEGLLIVHLANKYLQRTPQDPLGVVGFDVAGDDGSYPLAKDTDPMAAVVNEAIRLGVPTTLHAGEWPESRGSLDNLAWAVQSGARRIGHSIAIRSASKELIDLMKANNITVGVCLTSNVGFGYKVASFSEHPVRLMLQHGIPFTLSCDNTLLSGDEPAE